LRSSFGERAAHVRFVINIDPAIEFGIDEGIALGLIVNELVSNSLKYAFHDREDNQVTIGLRESLVNGYTLFISDNGWGIPESVDIGGTPTLGLQLVRNLTEQLRGTLILERDGGTVLQYQVPPPLMVSFTDNGEFSKVPWFDHR